MYKPYEIIFAASKQCNLHCSHCFVPNTPQKLDIQSAQKFLNTALDNGIDRIGFSGGEPFLYPEFLMKITETAVEKTMYFDRIMTNASWFNSTQELQEVLNGVYKAGFDGTICVSYDVFHNQDPEKTALFIETVFSIWKDRRVIELSAVKSILDTENEATVSMIEKLSAELNASVSYYDEEGNRKRMLPSELVFSKPLENAFIYYEDENDSIRINWIHQTGSVPSDPDFWQSREWFAEDYCEGPGQLLYVNADGSIAPCCGFANESEKLTIGSMYTMTLEQVLSNSKTMGIIDTVFEKGLLKEAKRMEEENHVFPGCGKTDNNCQFCSYYLSLKKT